MGIVRGANRAGLPIAGARDAGDWGREREGGEREGGCRNRLPLGRTRKY